ncbi:MAG: hypothetical protein UV38_C0002G0220 [candidate division TM6 bacterium GW2011_GWE2_42_60]|nr:MAG: hypothetical protein UV38_C0002G0220 [candidate division TM6 bacterium GW2011_GWE2_42_60]HBY06028.1 hypothetical protein [Candidatus Dependentiae bacterium]
MKRCIPTVVFLMMLGCKTSVCGDDEGPLGVFNPPPSPTPEVVAEAWEEPVEPEGAPTTVGEPTGNWYLKAQIFKKAEDLFNKLKKQITLVTPSRKDFDGRWQELDKKLDGFYQECGFQQGEIDARLKTIQEEIEQAKKTGMQAQELRDFLKKLDEKRVEVEKLKVEFSYVQKLDAASSKAIQMLGEEIEKALSYENKAWTALEKISDTLNDEAAEKLYRDIEVLSRNIAALDRYIKNDFTQFFTTLSSEIGKQTDTVRQKLTELRARGVELNKNVLAEQAKMEALKKEQERLQKEKTAAEAAKKSQAGWFSTLWSSIGNFFASIWHAITGLFSRSK